MSLEFLTTSLVIGNFFVLTGFFVAIILMYRYSTLVSSELKEIKQKISDQDKKIQTLQAGFSGLQILSTLTDPNLYYNTNYSTTPSLGTKKTTQPSKTPFSVIKNDSSKEDEKPTQV